ncbi:MAG: hypothetical protein HY235_02130 [Acidobacteria bacterium]|nr:hypothetical protein [Acidobacteriota bacterium]
MERQPLIVLRDEEAGIEAAIAPKAGGEMCGLRYRSGGDWIELLYRACDYSPAEGWRGKAPLLWPATGGTFGPGDRPGAQAPGSYPLGEKRYPMPFHGFAQSLEWKPGLVQANARGATAILTLADSDATRKYYPFGFLLSVEYRLADGRLTIAYIVSASNQNSQKMVFSIGNHITFRTPSLKGSDPAGMAMETAPGVFLVKDRNNLPTGETRAPPFGKRVALGDINANIAISLGGYEGAPTLTLTDPQGLRLRMRHNARKLPPQPFVQFNLWGDARAGYFSPEPWVGAQNSLNSRRGLVEIAPGEDWSWVIEIEPAIVARM